MATQILVIFLIGTAAPAWASRPQGALVGTSLGALGVAVSLALSPVGQALGFAALPWPVLVVIGGLVTGCLACTEGLKCVTWWRRPVRRHKPRSAHTAI